MRAEVLLAEELATRGEAMLRAMIAAAPEVGIEVVISERGYRGNCEILMTYGTGHPVRRPYWEAHRRTGRPCIGWDLGYWDRGGDSFSMRATLNRDHPPEYIRDEPAERFDSQAITLRNDYYDPAGPIVLVGMGRKGALLYAGGMLQWERRALAAIRAAYPGREVVFRPKRPMGPYLKGCRIAGDVPIEHVLFGASLVVCRHSNVGVDACIAGVPVVCEDGAAAALYGKDLKAPKLPTEDERRRFLRGLAYWNWKPTEARDAWKYLLSRL
jgi:hypothetical protein